MASEVVERFVGSDGCENLADPQEINLVYDSYSLVAKSVYTNCDTTARMQMFYSEANCLGNSSEIIAVWNQCYGPLVN